MMKSDANVKMSHCINTLAFRIAQLMQHKSEEVCEYLHFNNYKIH